MTPYNKGRGMGELRQDYVHVPEQHRMLAAELLRGLMHFLEFVVEFKRLRSGDGAQRPLRLYDHPCIILRGNHKSEFLEGIPEPQRILRRITGECLRIGFRGSAVFAPDQQFQEGRSEERRVGEEW